MSNTNKNAGSLKLSESIEDKELQKSVASLEAALEAQEKAGSDATAKIQKLEAALKSKDQEIAALKKVAPAGESQPAEKSLSDKDRTFSAKWKDPAGKEKSGKFMLEDVSKIYVSGKKYTPAEFMNDTEAQAIVAAAGTHPNIKSLKK